MKKLLLSLIAITTLLSCNKENSFVSISGKITNLKKTDTILTLKSSTFSRSIQIQENGSFTDTLTIPKADYFTLLVNNKNSGFIFLNNGFDLELATDNTSFAENINLKGKGASSSNFLYAQFKFGKKLGNPRALFNLEKTVFEKKIKQIKFSFDSLKTSYKNLDTMLVRTNDKQNNAFFNFLTQNYDREKSRSKAAEEIKNKLAKGNPSPKFNNYTNFKGGKKSLDSFKGKFVYIDVWATWCKPCIVEIPALKKLEKQYHKKNIQFVSISIDDERTAGSWDKAKTKWQKMVAKKNLTGSQLFAGKDLEFMKDYQVSSIPRFILIDPKGNIVNSNAPRPSDPSLTKLFTEVGL